MKSVDFLRNKLNTHLEVSRNKPRHYVAKPGNKPSELSSPCLRKNYYSYHKVPSIFPWKAENTKAKESGDRFHAQMRDWLKEMGMLVENLDRKTGEIPISFINGEPDPEFIIQDSELGIRWSKADGIIRIDDEGEYKGLWTLEIKSKKPDKFKKITGPERDAYQGNYYAFKLDEQLKQGKLKHIPGVAGYSEIRGCVYVYIDRGDGDTKEYFVEKDPKALEEFVTRAITVLEYVEQDELPPKTQDFCPWCPWRDKCSAEYKAPPPKDTAK